MQRGGGGGGVLPPIYIKAQRVEEVGVGFHLSRRGGARSFKTI